MDNGKPTLSSQISAFGERISRAMSRDGQESFEYADNMSTGSTIVAERSVSRGRELHSFGRGGLGNFRSVSALPATDDARNGPRGSREHSVSQSFGRGGVGNIRSASQEPTPLKDSSQSSPRSRSMGGHSTLLVSTGRGGVGNILRQCNPSALEEVVEDGRPTPERGRSTTKSIKTPDNPPTYEDSQTSN